jgi:hypothetical protein
VQVGTGFQQVRGKAVPKQGIESRKTIRVNGKGDLYSCSLDPSWLFFHFRAEVMNDAEALLAWSHHEPPL